MKSNKLSCKATNCVYNEKCECLAGIITVRGVHAESVPDTKCITFVEEGGYGFDRFHNCHRSEKTDVDEIRCSAGNCIHNENSACYADKVQIIAANASCGTFERKM